MYNPGSGYYFYFLTLCLVSQYQDTKSQGYVLLYDAAEVIYVIAYSV